MPAPAPLHDIIPVILGNPIRSQTLRLKRDAGLDTERLKRDAEENIAVEDIVQGEFVLGGANATPGEEETFDEGSTCFSYRSEPARYETGYSIIVNYWWNKEKSDCVENGILKAEDALDVQTFAHEVLPKIHNLLPVTTVDIETVGGSIKVSAIDRRLPKWMVYPHIPDSLARIPRLTISALRICRVTTRSYGVDIVTIQGDSDKEWYAFKRYAIPLENQGRPMEQLLSEVECLSRLHSTYIIKPSFLITENENESLFRGYLTPFMPAGTLNDVFEELPARGPLSQEPILSHPKLLDLHRPTAAPIKSSTPRLAWNVKHTWAIEAVTAVVALHDCGNYSGDIKAANILLDRNGHLQLIDVAPQMGYTDGYIAPELEIMDWNAVLPLSEARDIYAFGVVLWQIAEEIAETDFPAQRNPLDLIWRSISVSESTPQWYRDLVAYCVDTDPSARPTAKRILQVLHAQQEGSTAV